MAIKYFGAKVKIGGGPTAITGVATFINDTTKVTQEAELKELKGRSGEVEVLHFSNSTKTIVITVIPSGSSDSGLTTANTIASITPGVAMTVTDATDADYAGSYIVLSSSKSASPDNEVRIEVTCKKWPTAFTEVTG